MACTSMDYQDNLRKWLFREIYTSHQEDIEMEILPFVGVVFLVAISLFNTYLSS